MTTGLSGHLSATQGALIAPAPVSANRYYVFTLDAVEHNGVNGLRYTVVDMTMNGGLGGVVSKNDSLYAPISEKLTAVRHSNGKDLWIITHAYEGNQFLSFLVSSAGISKVPVVSIIGTKYSFTIGRSGQIKASPDGLKIAASVNGSVPAVELFRFNRATGMLSNKVSLIGTERNIFGVEFSPDGRKLYCTGDSYEDLYQYDLSGPWDSVTINNTLVKDGNSSNTGTGGLQLAPDGKIYHAHHFYENQKYLGVIHSPNSSGIACNYVDSGLYLGGRNGIGGLPNFVPDQLGYTPVKVAGLEPDSRNEVQVYPNPASGVLCFRVHDPASAAYQIVMYQITGGIIIQKDLKQHLTDVSVKDIAKGPYILRILKDQTEISEQVILVE